MGRLVNVVRGHQKLGGRIKGTANRRTLEVAELLESLGCNPIEGMVEIARSENATLELRGRMYAELAQFVFPKRKSVEHSGSINAPDFNAMSPEQIAALEKASEILEASGLKSN